MTGTADTIDAAITGDVSGQIAVGKDIFQVQTLQLTNNGGIVNLGSAAEIARPRPRATPAPFVFRPFRDLLDRESERETVLAGLAEQTTVELTGESGIGKSALLRHLANAPGLPAFANGVICLGQSLVAGKSVDDLLQTLFDAFYESAIPYKPSAAELRLALQEKRFLLVIDDCELDRDALNALLDAAPGCALLLSGAAPRLLGEGRSIAVNGLPIDAAVRLLERGLGRELRDDEQPSARELCVSLDGHPLRILQATAMMREEQASAAVMLERMQAAGSATTPAGLALAALPSDERRVLSALSAPAGIRLSADILGSTTGLEAPQPTLNSLVARGLAETDAGGYRLAESFSEYERAVLTSDAHPRETLSQLTRWVGDEARTPDEIQANGDAILHMLEWGAGERMPSETLALGRHAEAAFALSGSWDSWRRVLGWELDSARALGDRTAEAWALHQLGTRALCLNDLETARSSLGSALELRRALGDEAGSAATQHNLTLALEAPPAEAREQGRDARVWSGKLLAAAVALVGLGALAIWQITPPPGPVGPTPTPPLVASSTPLVVVVDPTSTATIERQITPTPTPTVPPTVTPSPTRDGPVASPDVPMADLVVQILELSGQPTIGIAPGFAQRDERLLAPMRIMIRNDGARAAPIFKVSASFTGQIGTTGRATFEAPLVVPGQTPPGYAFTTAPLAPGGVVTFGGTIVLPLSLAGQTVAVQVIADSCASEERQPPYCRVEEEDERNNTSAAVQLQLPTRPTPTPTRPLQTTPTRTATPRVIIN